MPFPMSSPAGVGAFAEPKNNQEATCGFLGEEDKIALETHCVSYMRVVENHPSTKSKVPKIGNKFKFISSIFTPYPLQGNHDITSQNISFIMIISQLIYLYLINILITN